MLRVSDLMTRDVVAARPDDSLATLRDLMFERDVRHMPVIEGEADLVGLVSQRDLLRSSLIEQPDMPDFIEDALLERLRVRELMTTGVVSIEPERDIREAAQIMFENKYGCLPVTLGTRLVGILTESDFVRLMAEGN
ncbi:MAG: CBS domain-containing protein [bacterium]|nr:CBS domain-containing protein [bacterium]